MSDTLEEWFRREILPHEAALMRLLACKWTRPDDMQDLRHDIYVRILEAAAHKRPTSPRGFLLSVARHLLVDRARRNRVVSIDLLEDVDALNVLIDEVSPERATTGRQQVQRLSALFDRLPGRCRQVVWMRRVEDRSQKEIASHLGIAEATVEKHLVRGISLLADALYGVTGAREGATHVRREARIRRKHVDE